MSTFEREYVLLSSNSLLAGHPESMYITQQLGLQWHSQLLIATRRPRMKLQRHRFPIGDIFRIKHSTGVIWASCRLKSPAMWRFVQQVVEASNKRNKNAMHYWTGGFHSQKVSDEKSSSIAWRHYDKCQWNGSRLQGSLCVCTQRMRGGVTLWHLSLAKWIHKMIPAIIQFALNLIKTAEIVRVSGVMLCTLLWYGRHELWGLCQVSYTG